MIRSQRIHTVPRLLGWLALAATLLGTPAFAQGVVASKAKLDAASQRPWMQRLGPGGHVEKLYGSATAPYLGKSGDAADRFLKDYAPLLGLKGDGEDLERTRLHGGDADTHVWYRRKAFGLPVYGSVVAVHLNGERRVVMVDNKAPGIETMAAGADTVGTDTAAAIAIGAAGSPADARIDEGPEKMLFAEGGVAQPAWRMRVWASRPPTDREVLVSAIDGTVLKSTDLIRRGTGNVFLLPPPVFLGDPNMSDQDDTAAAVPQGAYVSKQFETASNVRGFFELRNRYLQTYAEGSSGTATSANGVFNFLRSDARFEQVNAFFHVTDTIRFLTEDAAGPSVPEARPRTLSVVAHAFEDANAFYRGGSQPSISFGDGGVDSGEDADVIVHELGHAILDKQVPDIVSTDGRAVHEGFADFIASAALSRHLTAGGLPDSDPACTAEWFGTAFPPSVKQGGGRCLRRTDDQDTPVKHYPESLDSAREEHADGELYSRFLWKVRQGFVDRGNATRRNAAVENTKAMRLALRANNFFTSQVTFDDAVRAVITAHEQDTASADRGLFTTSIVQSAIDRGFLGVEVTSVTPTFAFLGTTTPLFIQGSNFAGVSSVALGDGATLRIKSVPDNNTILVDLPPRITGGTLSAIVANYGTTAAAVLPIKVDDHPNTVAEVLQSPDPNRDTITVNAVPAKGSIEVVSAPLPSTGAVVREVDVYRFSVIQGHRYNLSLRALTGRDTILRVLDQNGVAIASNDNVNEANGDLNSAVSVVATTTTTYYAQAEFQPGRIGTYSINIVDPQAADDHPNLFTATRDPADRLLSTTASAGIIEYAGDLDFFYFAAEAGATYDLSTTLPKTGGLKDSVVTVFDPNGVAIAENDDTAEQFGSRASLIRGLQTPLKATYYVQVRHADLVASTSIGSYELRLRRNDPSLDIREVSVPAERFSRGQTIPLTVTIANTGVSVTLTQIRPALKFRNGAADRSLDYFLTAQQGNPSSLAPGATGVYRFSVVPKATALSGLVSVDASATGTGTNGALVSDPSSARTTSFRLETPAILSAVSVTAVPPNVSRGQTTAVTVSVANLGQATAVVSAAFPTFAAGGEDRALDYTVTPAPALPGDNPDRIAGGQRGVFRYLVDVGQGALLGRVTLQAMVRGLDANSGLAVTPDFAADIPDTWNVQTPANLSLVRLSGPAERVSAGSTVVVSLTVTNTGLASLELTGTQFTFSGLDGDQTLQYSVTPFASNPPAVAGGSAALLRYSVGVANNATTGPVSVSALVQGRDANSLAPFSSNGNGQFATFFVEPAAGLLVTKVAAPAALVSRGQTAIVTVTLVNTGGASSRSTTSTLKFSSASGTPLDIDYVVTPLPGNPTLVAGGFQTRHRFQVAIKSGATTGPVTIRAVGSGIDVNSGLTVSANAAGISTSWLVQRAAALSIASFTASPAVVQRGGLLALSLTVANSGEAPAEVTRGVFTLKTLAGSDRSTEYTIVAAGTNPASIPGGSSRELRFTALASGGATTGTITAGATLEARDANSKAALTVKSAQSRTFRLGFVTAQVLAPLSSDLLFFDESISFRVRAVEDTGVAIPDGSIVWTADDTNRLGTGATLVAALTPGAHSVLVQASSPTGMTTSARLFLQVNGAQPPANLLIVGGTLRGPTGASLGAGHRITVRNASRNLLASAVTDAGGKYSAIFSPAEPPAAAHSDVLLVEMVDSQEFPREVTPSLTTVLSRDLLSSRKTVDLAAADLIDMRFDLVPGLNLIAFPARPVQRGSAAVDTTVVLTATGASFIARVPATGNPETDKLVIQPRSAPSVNNGPIEPGHGYLLSMPVQATLILKGLAWPAGSRNRLLVKGNNYVGLPEGVPASATSQTLSEATDRSPAVTRTKTNAQGRGVFETWVPGGRTFALESGKGYIVVPMRGNVRVNLPGR